MTTSDVSNVSPAFSNTVCAPAGGGLVFISGQVPVGPGSASIPAGDPERQVRQVFENLTACLAKEGLTWAHALKLTIYLTDLSIRPILNAVRAEYQRTPPPASTLVQVAGLIDPAWLVEIDLVATTVEP